MAGFDSRRRPTAPSPGMEIAPLLIPPPRCQDNTEGQPRTCQPEGRQSAPSCRPVWPQDGTAGCQRTSTEAEHADDHHGRGAPATSRLPLGTTDAAGEASGLPARAYATGRRGGRGACGGRRGEERLSLTSASKKSPRYSHGGDGLNPPNRLAALTIIWGWVPPSHREKGGGPQAHLSAGGA